MKKQTFVRTSFRLAQKRLHQGGIYSHGSAVLWKRKFHMEFNKGGQQKLGE